MTPSGRIQLSRRTFLSGIVVTGAVTRFPTRSSAQADSSIAWERVAAEGAGPTPRWDHILVADAAQRRLILFGGRDATGAALGDTWVFDIVTAEWNEIPGTQPPARFGVAASVDASGGGVYLFGGQQADIFYNDTWRYDFPLDAWQPIDPGDGVAPTPRYGLGGVVDDMGRFIISHGFTSAGRFDDTWAFDIAAGGWTDISPPEDARPMHRCLHEQVWDSESGRMLLYAGCSSGFGPCPQGDAWTFDPVLGIWSEVTPAAGPDARSNPALTQFPANSMTLLVGGLTAAGYAGDAWLGRLKDGMMEWASIQPTGQAPGPRASHDMAALGNQVFLFGGNSDAGALDDLWSATLS
ncbi:MAG TPA: kelch repeat-containing protein [Thermomicrobiales bacterium]|nr:kelch repeat-containing protein [Thermomicrobiales bacterium]